MSTNDTVLLFPGQGVQRVGMGVDLFESSRSARDVFARVEAFAGMPLARYCFDGPEDVLRLTEVAQPALFAVEIAAIAALVERLAPGEELVNGAREALGVGWTCGHSLGEYAACVAAGAISIDDGAALAVERGRLMADAPEGAMSAILGMDAARLAEICAGVRGLVVVANDNSPGQVVISGEPAAVAEAGESAKAAGASRVLPLNVGGGFHSPLMSEPAARFASALAAITVCAPQVPIIGNTSAQPLRTAGQVLEELLRQMTGPVLWRDSVELLAGEAVIRGIECGPGNVLAGLVRRTAPQIAVLPLGSVGDIARLATTVAAP